MPPKKAPAPSKKTEQKKKEKIVEDKTFGLKNKKGAKTQKFIQQVIKQTAGNQKRPDAPPAVKKKDEKKRELDELNQIFKPVLQVQKVEFGVDPKSVVCIFFKQGQCTKGDRCKFSHDLNLDRRSQKRNVYCDARDESDNMENWDEYKLKEVVEKKHGEKERGLPKTDIICKHFIDALEENKYGWFWECPNGGDKCHYRHALPPGFVLKKDKKKEKKDEISIEDLVENERAKLPVEAPKLTLESFVAWKKRKIEEKRSKNEMEMDRKRAEFKAGKNTGLSGREMFTFNPDLVTDETLDDDEATVDNILREDDEEIEKVTVKEIDFNSLQNEARECDGTGTVVSERVFNVVEIDHGSKEGASNEPTPTTSTADVVVDENLFAEDLDNLDEELNALSVD